MARRNRRLLIPDAQRSLDRLKVGVMAREGLPVDPDRPDSVKYEVAKELGIPFKPGYNGDLTAKQAGKIGGQIGGKMVREMIRLAQAQLADRQRP